MPNAETFSIIEIDGFVRSYLMASKVSIDPFARNKRLATFTNDLNPETAADYHLEALEFLKLMKSKGIKADLAFFDPPYSPRQVMECYQQVGRKASMEDTQGKAWTDWKSALAEVLTDEAIVLSFGWNSSGMGKKNGFEIIEILLCCHGGMHNDTICTAERRIKNQQALINL